MDFFLFLCNLLIRCIMADRYLEIDKMSDLISDDYRLLQVISRFGISLGFGERSVREVCEIHGVDCPTFLAVANFTRFRRNDSESRVEQVSVKSLSNYLSQSHSYYLDFQFPNIRRKLLEAMMIGAEQKI